MKSNVKKISLTSVDDLFSTEESRIDDRREKIVELPLEQLRPFAKHPFKVLDNEAMMDTVASVKEYGVLVPAIARPLEAGVYEIVAGHRRHRASQLAELETMPVIIRELDDDEATIIMVDSNLQRENILPSERAFAYKMKLDAMKRTAGRPLKNNCSQVGDNLRSVDLLSKNSPDSARQIQRFIRLTYLVPELLTMVDEKKVAFNPAVEISYLQDNEQYDLMEAIEIEQSTPSLSQAQRLKKFSAEGKLSFDVICAIMGEEKKPELDRITLSSDKISKYFPQSYDAKRMEETILKLLESWHKKRVQNQER